MRKFKKRGKGTRDASPEASQTNTRVVMIALGAVILAVALFWITEHDHWFAHAKSVQATLNQVAGLIIATGLLTAVWELFGRRNFTREVLAAAHLSSDVADSGITRITDQYLEDVQWAELFEGVVNLDIVVAYARTWRNLHWKRLQDVAGRDGARLRVFLPDPDDAQTMDVLAKRFATDPASLKVTVRDAITEFSSLAVGARAKVEVFVRPGDAVFSCYRFDSHAVLTLYSHSKERRTSVPTFIVGQGKLFKFVRDDIDAIHEQSSRVEP